LGCPGVETHCEGGQARQCPLWVISGPLAREGGTSALPRRADMLTAPLSAKCQKRTSGSSVLGLLHPCQQGAASHVPFKISSLGQYRRIRKLNGPLSTGSQFPSFSAPGEAVKWPHRLSWTATDTTGTRTCRETAKALSCLSLSLPGLDCTSAPWDRARSR
jgi:hypothetical protein